MTAKVAAAVARPSTTQSHCMCMRVWRSSYDVHRVRTDAAPSVASFEHCLQDANGTMRLCILLSTVQGRTRQTGRQCETQDSGRQQFCRPTAEAVAQRSCCCCCCRCRGTLSLGRLQIASSVMQKRVHVYRDTTRCIERWMKEDEDRTVLAAA